MTSHLEILYEDSACLAVVKAGGQFTQGTWAPPGEMTLEEAVRRHLDPLSPASVYLGIVHRLDRPTSGVLLWAKTPKAARRLSSQFEGRRVVKEYCAVVELGHREAGPERDAGSESLPDHPGEEATWCDWLTRTSTTGLARVVVPETPGARRAVTRVRRVAARALPPGCAGLRLWPQTGRTHQLRAQTAARGMPILGDSPYGSTGPFLLPEAIALHARSLEVMHPILQTRMVFWAPIPPEWRRQGIDLAD
jgi:23S rRNA pseudouridine1911/1915/1917 synthase